MFCKVIGMNHFAEAPTLFADHDDVQRVTTRAPSYLADHRKRLRERLTPAGRRRSLTMNCWNWSCSTQSHGRMSNCLRVH